MQFYPCHSRRSFLFTILLIFVAVVSSSLNPLGGSTNGLWKEEIGTRSISGTRVAFLPIVAKKYPLASPSPTPIPTQPPSPSATPPRPFPGNFIVNPWFRKLDDPTKSGLDGWSQKTDAGAWSHSQKASNPSPDQITGTAARWADGTGMGGGPGVAGANAYLYQIVAANPSDHVLQFQIWWIVLWIEEAKATIYGGNSPSGPWTEVWMPFRTVESQGASTHWAQTAKMELQLDQGYSYYKVELYGKYPVGTTAGVKYTGVFFRVSP